jgi:hypothetical protein
MIELVKSGSLADHLPDAENDFSGGRYFLFGLVLYKLIISRRVFRKYLSFQSCVEDGHG